MKDDTIFLLKTNNGCYPVFINNEDIPEFIKYMESIKNIVPDKTSKEYIKFWTGTIFRKVEDFFDGYIFLEFYD